MPSRLLASLLTLAFIVGALLAPSHGTAAAVPVSSRITAVAVYPDRAVLTRQARVELPPGESELVIDGLPAALVDESLQVSGRGTAAATILDVNLRRTFLEASPDPRLRTLEEELAGLQREYAALEARLGQIDQQRALLQRIENALTAPPSKDSPGARPSLEEWQLLLVFQAENLSRLAGDQQSLQQQRTALAAKIAAVEAQLNDLKGRMPPRRSQRAAAVRVSASRAGTLDLVIAYATPGASWSPAYDARLRAETRAIDVTYYGVLRNGTGEDWNGVALTLSTARPGLGGGAPALSPWIVEPLRPVQMGYLAQSVSSGEFKAMRRSANALPEAAAPATAGATAAESDAVVAEASVETGLSSATFRIDAPLTLPSDRSTQKVVITTLNCPADLRYETAPKLIEAAYLSASGTNRSDFPWLAGPVNAFLGDTFIATSTLRAVSPGAASAGPGALRALMPGESFALSLGVDDGIAVKRRIVKRFTEDTGLTNSGRRITHEYVVTLTNNKKTAERIVLREPTPVSRDEKIVVKVITPAERDIGSATAPKEVMREPDGILVWRIDLKPGEKREVPIKLTIEHPADLNVTGLD
ncbi:MAG: mucoidy inhibitor MuiA family protein [Verrucomicrobia bacterium]|nr:mucoidy inhibitor MuiA family protein [Verrucomicrobiota bacterium]